MDTSLTHHAIKNMLNGVAELKPVLQVVEHVFIPDEKCTFHLCTLKDDFQHYDLFYLSKPRKNAGLFLTRYTKIKIIDYKLYNSQVYKKKFIMINEFEVIAVGDEVKRNVDLVVLTDSENEFDSALPDLNYVKQEPSFQVSRMDDSINNFDAISDPVDIDSALIDRQPAISISSSNNIGNVCSVQPDPNVSELFNSWDDSLMTEIEEQKSDVLTDDLSVQSSNCQIQVTSRISHQNNSSLAKGFTTAFVIYSERLVPVIKENIILSISELDNRFSRKEWAIRGRIMNKSVMRALNNNGKCFDFIIADSSGNIKVSVFGLLCDKYFNTIKVGNIYALMNLTIKIPDKRWSKDKYELKIEFNSTIIEVPDDGSYNYPLIKFSFKEIALLDHLPIVRHPDETMVDIIGIVRFVGHLDSAAIDNLTKRKSIVVMDQSKCEVVVTCWNTTAVGLNVNLGDVIIFKGARLCDYGGRSLTTSQKTLILVNPSLPIAKELHDWFQQFPFIIPHRIFGGYDSQEIDLLKNIVATKTVTWHKVKASIYNIIPKIYYACSECKKKLKKQLNGDYKCYKCNKFYSFGKKQVCLTALLSDASDEIQVGAFNEVSLSLFGFNLNDLPWLNEEHLISAADDIENQTFHIFIRTILPDNNNDDHHHRIISFKKTQAIES